MNAFARAENQALIFSFCLKRQKVGSNYPPGHCWLIRRATRQTAIVGSIARPQVSYVETTSFASADMGEVFAKIARGHHFCGGE